MPGGRCELSSENKPDFAGSLGCQQVPNTEAFLQPLTGLAITVVNATRHSALAVTRR